ncbi:MAG: ACT domain-containing protein [Oscillospiraceae bacterium]|jgi:ACT domain-containing protein|nr:ACT domain-containing protein [Oscillospiraceae bacterium]
MKGIITVLGQDRVGIIARVCTYLAEQGINILDISQTIVHGYFNMVMMVDLTENKGSFEQTAAGLEDVGRSIGVRVKLQREDIFDAMHRV